jgi:hypothetical protein
VSVTIDLSGRELKLSLFKIGLLLTILLLTVGFGISLLADDGQSVAINALLLAMACLILANSVLAALKIVDWFEARRAKRNA